MSPLMIYRKNAVMQVRNHKIFIFSRTAPLKQKFKLDNISFKVMAFHM